MSLRTTQNAELGLSVAQSEFDNSIEKLRGAQLVLDLSKGTPMETGARDFVEQATAEKNVAEFNLIAAREMARAGSATDSE